MIGIEVFDTDNAVTVLMDTMRHVGGVTACDVFAIDVQRPSPLALVMPFEPAVKPGAEVEAGR